MPGNSKLSANYWDSRYLDQDTGWDIGCHNTIHTDYITHIDDKSVRILEPGAGNAYTTAYLYSQGYYNTYALDYARTAKSIFLEKNPAFPKDQYLTQDFFELHELFDVVLEQTFFCAIDPKRRHDYVNKMYNILNPKGKIYGVLFDFKKNEGPPYGGSKEEYVDLFGSKFNILRLESSKNSIPQRQGIELVVELQKK